MAAELTMLGGLVEKRWALRCCQTEDGTAVSGLVFPIRDHQTWNVDAVWRKAAIEAKVPGRPFYNYRLTAVRNLIRAASRRPLP